MGVDVFEVFKIKTYFNTGISLLRVVTASLVLPRYDIHVLHEDTKRDKRGQRIINGIIGLSIPNEKIRNKMKDYKA